MIWNKNLNAYFYQGIYWIVFYSITFMFIKAYAVELGASNFMIGVIGAIPFLAIFLAEIPGAVLGNKYDHKKLTAIISLVGRLFWFGIIFSSFLFAENALFFIIICFFLSEFFTWLPDPPWMEMIAEIIPKKIRGSYMAYRDRALICTKMITILAAGFFIDRMTNKIFGYNVLFSIAVFFGLGSIYYIKKLEVKQKPLHKIYHFKDFFKSDGQFRKFLTYSVFFDFAHMICSPFFIVYLLKNVGLSLGTYSLVIVLEALSSILTQERLGKFSDKYGDKKVHMICLVGAVSTPLLYLLFIHPSTVWMLIPVSIINGFAWGGYNLTRKNLFLDATSNDREVKVAEYQTLTAFPMIIAPLIGGFIADNVTFIISGIPLLFAIAFILRALSALLILRVSATRVKSKKSTVKIFEEFLHFPHFTTHHFSTRRHNKS